MHFTFAVSGVICCPPLPAAPGGLGLGAVAAATAAADAAPGVIAAAAGCTSIRGCGRAWLWVETGALIPTWLPGPIVLTCICPAVDTDETDCAGVVAADDILRIWY